MTTNVIEIRRGDILIISNENDVSRAKTTGEFIVKALLDSESDNIYAIPVRDDTDIVILRKGEELC